MAINNISPKKGKVVDIPTAPTIGTATAGGESATVAFTAATRGGPVTTYTALSNPGSITGTGSSSPITVSGLTVGTSYTFTVRGSNATGNGEYSAASNSIVPIENTSFESIATITTTGNPITFSSIPGTYKHLQLRIIGKSSNTTYSSIYWTVRLNGDSGNNYNSHSIYGNGSTAAAMYNGTYVDQMIAGEIVASGGGMASQNSSPMIIDLLDYSNTSKNTVIRSLGGFDGNGTGTIRFGSGLWMNTAAVTSISLFGGDAGTLHAALYGIKG